MVNRLLLCGLPALAICLTCAAGAADAPASGAVVDIDQTLTRCLADPEKQSTGGQDECIVDATHAWDVRLNATYQSLRDALPESARPALLAAQRAWLASRDADLKLIAAVYATVHGTMYAPANANDVMLLTQRRAQTLARYRGDVSSAASEGSLPASVKVAGHAQSAEVDRWGRRMARRLPSASRGIVRTSNEKWRDFTSAEKGLIAAVCPSDGNPNAQVCRNAQAARETTARVQWLKGLDGMIGAD
ncbi:lysozyme inhibitor LprI family protein [Pandoraea commovens]|uniref:Lysozyme inhibitor LprI-like N-terminal domain-containing protein n=1 Tax=Pandoraea commovens TaxID=2508289 RepID=A0A5E4RJ21_9BURK|nr:lysozyme inhibitor LprI family protein [Pandoraea commovens]VVD62029.1 hypothetical protein PCO31010_00156 [Pandoraea commovens]